MSKWQYNNNTNIYIIDIQRIIQLNLNSVVPPNSVRGASSGSTHTHTHTHTHIYIYIYIMLKKINKKINKGLNKSLP